MRRMKKKAVSPLIATVLLIAFAVALGAVVMNWGRGYVQETTDKATEGSAADLACTSDVSIGLVELDGVRQFCYNETESRVEFLIENRKGTDLEEIKCRVLGEDSRVPETVSAMNETGGVDGVDGNTVEFMYCEYDDATLGAPKQVQIVPLLIVEGQLASCAPSGLDVVNIKPCTDIYD